MKNDFYFIIYKLTAASKPLNINLVYNNHLKSCAIYIPFYIFALHRKGLMRNNNKTKRSNTK